MFNSAKGWAVLRKINPLASVVLSMGSFVNASLYYVTAFKAEAIPPCTLDNLFRARGTSTKTCPLESLSSSSPHMQVRVGIIRNSHRQAFRTTRLHSWIGSSFSVHGIKEFQDMVTSPKRADAA